MSRHEEDPLEEAESLLEEHGIPYRRISSRRLQVEDLVLDADGTLRVHGNPARLPNTGVHELMRLLRRREAFRRRYGAARPPGADAREADPGRRARKRRLERASNGRRRAERERDEIWAEWLKALAEREKAEAERNKALAEWEKTAAERDKALAKLRKAKRRLWAKSAERDDLRLELREG
ncbi:MAG: hypothetical protein ICV73_10865 [Acetobacteraceae bacterium]|nr:hypothetical protein [Acetobacteraceae bacterium]